MPSLLACPASYLSFAPDIILLDFFTAYHGGRDVIIYERIVRMLLRGSGTAATAQPPVVMPIGFFEFGDRHHARSTFTTMGSQLAAAHGRGISSVVSLWHSRDPDEVGAMADLIRTWARGQQRSHSSTDVTAE